MTRQTLVLDSSRVASARTATVMVCVPAFPPMLATIGISTASATILASASSKLLITQEASSAVSRFANSQGKRPLAMRQTEFGQLFLAADTAERADVLLGLLLDDIDDVVEGDHPDEPVVLVDDRCGHEVIALEQSRHVLLVLGDPDRTQILVRSVPRSAPAASSAAADPTRPRPEA